MTLGRRRSVYEILLIPTRPMRKQNRGDAAELLESETLTDDT
ncbi:MAG TPA: hypothetical protein QGH10_02400 [Armatimonadota bacterium]|nr:hypothetical protein [Armatimonadota bacterium]